ncbi:type I methionyl aminopeptidase [Brevibacterium casei]|uniref:Methionine aminopeptidase n=1 Tax=Brevibacterium casei CIP 102111 TaxID=1255625 RepID=A0A2H1IPR3_9MICO|nr:type I methionyl aminopeptidase [Brevibacterium casei]MCT1551012.1 type I methionyl aminopeptidase [Brevibacterium casei]MCT1561671.1 type I methionyl aminopeptidase [Brevibacterium casei]MCT2209464.1 type I methionyl aminopeptidase [Brevibacterium casei]QPR39817.1 type I methionyl aminopeptidase [Brevibacterium casei]QPR43981.1 type I methionyl aminopeptidase [Brevibacterium casei]
MIFGPRIELKSPAELVRMHRAGLVTRAALDAARAAAVPGATTAEVDAAAERAIADAGATSNFKGYQGFPAVLCISVNEEIVHGIPGKRVLERGDLVSIDGGAIVGGFHGDSAFTMVVGGDDAGTEADRALSRATEGAMWAGIAAFATGTKVSDIGDAIDDYVTEAAPALGLVEEFTGHGIGTAMHMAPEVLNYRAKSNGPKIRPGMCLAIEPMLTAGSPETVTLADDWTVVTADGSRASHWEHSVARHADGVWVLTAADGGAAGLAPFGIVPVPPAGS